MAKLTNKEIKDLALQQFNGEKKWTDVGTFAAYDGIASLATSAYAVPALIIGGPLDAGYSKYLLKRTRKEETKFLMLFDGFKQFGKFLVAGLWQALFVALWSLLFFIPGIIKAYAYRMQFFIMQDHPEMSGKEALDESEKLMYGHKWELFCLQLRFLGWILLGILTFGVLLYLYVGPWMSLAEANFYNNLIGKEEAATEENK